MYHQRHSRSRSRFGAKVCMTNPCCANNITDRCAATLVSECIQCFEGEVTTRICVTHSRIHRRRHQSQDQITALSSTSSLSMVSLHSPVTFFHSLTILPFVPIDWGASLLPPHLPDFRETQRHNATNDM